ncbi:MAG: DUF554 domain-containing protein [Clostridia bacterium]|nr:DUF554 domain-containing protein [Clostridia bacterium]
MIGTLINAFLILVGTALGLVLRRGLPERLKNGLLSAMGLATILIGLKSAIGTTDTLSVIVCMALGTLLGSALNIEKQLDRFGRWTERKLSFLPRSGEEGSIAKGFVTATLVYCVGAMAIVGSISSALQHDHSTLIAKGIIDGLTAIVFTSTLGIGVGLSAFAVLVYQGLISLLAIQLSPVLTDLIINEMSAVGGLLIAAIGLNMIYDKHIPVGNMLPAIFLPIVYIPLSGLFA